MAAQAAFRSPELADTGGGEADNCAGHCACFSGHPVQSERGLGGGGIAEVISASSRRLSVQDCWLARWPHDLVLHLSAVPEVAILNKGVSVILSLSSERWRIGDPKDLAVAMVANHDQAAHCHAATGEPL